MSITTITYHCPTSCMGDTSEQDAAGYREWLASELRSEFPGASVTVTNQERTNSLETDAGIDDLADVEHLQEFVQDAWGRCNWEWA